MTTNRSQSQPLLISVCLAIFALKPIIDLFWFMGGFWMGQRIDLAAIIGVFLIGAFCIFIADAVMRDSWHDVVARWRFLLGMFVATLAFLILKQFYFGFDDPVLIVRIISFLSILVGLPFFLQRYTLASWQMTLFYFSVGVLMLLSLMQIQGIVPTTVVDTINSHNIGRITAGFGHPLALSRVLCFVGVLLVTGLYKNWRDRQHVLASLCLLTFCLLFYIMLKSTYRTGIIFFGLLPFSLLFFPTVNFKTRLFEYALVCLCIFFTARMSNTVSMSALFGHSAGLPDWHPPTVVHTTPVHSEDSPLMHLARGRGAKWLVFSSAIESSSLWNLLIGHPSISLTTQGEEWHEPHNLLLLILYDFGVVGLGLLAGFYLTLWKGVQRFFRDDCETTLVAALLFSVPLWHGITAEPIRYPTFATMLFFCVAAILHPPQTTDP